MLGAVAIAGAASSVGLGLSAAQAQPGGMANRPYRIGVSTYSFWHFKGKPVPIFDCIEQAALMGFDGVEILHVHMEKDAEARGRKVNGYFLNEIKQHAFSVGIPLMGFSTHQGFVSPEPEVRKKNIAHTAECLRLAHELGIPHPRQHRPMGHHQEF